MGKLHFIHLKDIYSFSNVFQADIYTYTQLENNSLNILM